MADRKALLVGVEHFGDGFPAMPAAAHDVALLAPALQAAGYETQLCSADQMASATALDRAIRSFCGEGGPDDVRIVYYSGHGLHADGVDWVVPSHVSLMEAMTSASQRVSTDLSATVSDSDVGLVLFIIDACRDLGNGGVGTDSSAWGSSRGLAQPDETRFVRYFGCAAREVCLVIDINKGRQGGAPTLSSFFTHALADRLSSQDAVSLEALRAEVESCCQQLRLLQPLLPPQTPHLSYGEINNTRRQVLHKPIFDPVGPAAMAALWPAFDPAKLHCLVVLSEHAVEHAEQWGLQQLVRAALAGKSGSRLWRAFRAVRHGQRMAVGSHRQLPEVFDMSRMVLASVTVLQALASADNLDRCVRALVQADLVVFDVTGFEPGVMLLAGIRSASRRGLSVCSHGAGWTEGSAINVPFNLQDLNLNAHTASAQKTGDDPVVQRFVQRVETGFQQMARQPDYHDLPGFDALRRLGPAYEASSTLGVKDQVLVLCSFDKDFQHNWSFIRAQLDQALARRGTEVDHIERIIDYGSPQLVLQSLFEQLRRTAACVVDWSGFRASVFLELGVRLAVSEWGAVQLVDTRYLPGGECAVANASEPNAAVLPERQIGRLLRLFTPLQYKGLVEQDTLFDAVAAELLPGSTGLNKQPTRKPNAVYKAVQDCIDAVQDAQPPVALDLQRRADALHHTKQSTEGAPQVLYAGNHRIKQDAERAALELRIAAWLYLENRIGVAGLRADAGLAEAHGQVGRAAVDALYDLGDDNSIALAEKIEASLNLKKA